MERLLNPIRGYAWGSRSVIATLQGRPRPSDGPEAELWVGAHPSDPSILDRPEAPVPLPEAIAADPDIMLGPASAAEFGPRLPYLLKLLAAEQPLSLQAHPDAAQAEAGYVAGNPSYVDQYHKPELLVAVSEFEALCGFRDPKYCAELLAALDVRALDPVLAALRAGAPDGLRRAVTMLLTWPAKDRRSLVDAVVKSASAAAPAAAASAATATSAATAAAVAAPATVVGPALAAVRPAALTSALDAAVTTADARLVAGLAARYPGDVGVVVALLLNHVTLMPGEAIWMPAGNLHAYLRGTGIEIMAASDNVLRGGLTPKHVDVDELLRVLRFEVLADAALRPVPVMPAVVTWAAPVREFALYRARLGGATPRIELGLDGPREVLCMRGEVRVDDGFAAVTLRAGQAAFGRATRRPLVCSGSGELYIAALPAS